MIYMYFFGGQFDDFSFIVIGYVLIGVLIGACTLTLRKYSKIRDGSSPLQPR